MVLRHPKEEHPNPIMDVIVPDLEAAALDHALVAVVIEMIVTDVVIVVAVAAVVVVDRDREAVIVAGGGRGVDRDLMTGGGVEVLGRDRIAVVEVMIVATEG